jgi:putative transcriptional regulator
VTIGNQKVGKSHEKLLNNLEELRKAANLTQQELSESAEVSRKSINAIENGIYVPSTVLALKIARTLNCSVEELFRLP